MRQRTPPPGQQRTPPPSNNAHSPPGNNAHGPASSIDPSPRHSHNGGRGAARRDQRPASPRRAGCGGGRECAVVTAARGPRGHRPGRAARDERAPAARPRRRTRAPGLYRRHHGGDHNRAGGGRDSGPRPRLRPASRRRRHQGPGGGAAAAGDRDRGGLWTSRAGWHPGSQSRPPVCNCRVAARSSSPGTGWSRSTATPVLPRSAPSASRTCRPASRGRGRLRRRTIRSATYPWSLPLRSSLPWRRGPQVRTATTPPSPAWPPCARG